MSTEPTTQIAIRLPVSLIDRIEAFAEQLREEHPGASFNRADAIRMLLLKALDAKR